MATASDEPLGVKELASAIPALLAVLDARGTIVLTNDAWRRFVAANLPEGVRFDVGVNYIEFFETVNSECSDDARRLAAGAQQLLAGQIDRFSHEYMCHPGQESRWLRADMAALGGNPPTGALVMHTDITEQKRAESALAESERRFRAMVEQSWEAVSMIDEQGELVYTSPSAMRILGYSPEELHGMNLFEHVHPDDLVKIGEAFADLVSTPEASRTAHYRFRHKNGSWLWLEGTGKNLLSDPSVRAIVATYRDVTERKRAADLAHQQQTELAHISRLSSMGELATGLAHELNQPLTAIAHYADAFVQTMRTSPSADREKLLGWAQKIGDQAERAAQMIRRLRSFIRKAEPYRARVELADLVYEAVDLMETDSRLHGMKIDVELDESVAVRVDAIQIQQVLVNLVRNALESMAANGPERHTVTVRSTIGLEAAVISVEDQGIGIPQEYLDRVFEPFFTSKADGLGLGLGISRSIIEDHGGRLWVTRNPEHGMTFHFTLPTNTGEDGRGT